MKHRSPRSRRRWTALISSLTAVAVALPAARAAAATTSMAKFVPIADAYVDARYPSMNYGSASRLSVRGSRPQIAYIRFSVQGLNGPVSSAVLRLSVTRGTADGFAVASVSDSSWTESGITYENAPPPGPVLGATGPTTSGTKVSVGVTAAVSWNGVFTFALIGSTTDQNRVASRDAAANRVEDLVVKYARDATGPAVPTGLIASAGGATEVDLSWAPSSGPNGVAGYTVYRGGTALAVVDHSVTTYADHAVAPSTSYTYTVDAFDSLGNHSAQSDPASATTAADTTAPSVPTQLAATEGPPGQIDLSWRASTDDVGVAGYTVYRGGSPIGTAGGTNYADTGLPYSKTETYAVDAFDAAANHSDPGSPVTVATRDPVIAAAGDIACSPADPGFNGGNGTATRCRELSTSNLLTGTTLAGVLPLGDEQYDKGQLTYFQRSYDPTWGRVKPISYPVPGNHEYDTSGASGYYQYFGSLAGDPAKGWYSFDVGTWHLVALNAECASIGGCGAGAPEEKWLKADLAAHPTACTLAYWHQPRFSSGTAGNNTNYSAFWSDLYAAHADLVLNGHDHDYERFAIQSAGEKPDPKGIREIVVGTGGEELHGWGTVQSTSQLRNNQTFGVLVLTLGVGSYSWEFVPEQGASFTDSGTDSCR